VVIMGVSGFKIEGVMMDVVGHIVLCAIGSINTRSP